MMDKEKLERLVDQAHGTALASVTDAAAQFDHLPEHEAAFAFSMWAIENVGEVIPLAMMAGALAVRLHRTSKLNSL